MGATATAEAANQGRRRMAAAALLGIGLLALLYLAFLFQVYNDPGVREIGFTGPTEIRNYSALVFVLLFALMLAVWMRWVPTGPPAAAAGASAASGAAAQGRSAPGRTPAGAADPASRPGAPPSTRIPLIPPESLQSGWKRFKFPAERTGGLYVDSDIVVDDTPPEIADNKSRGRIILRVRDEVARVCVRCELQNHCHGKVAALITLEDMRGNHECVPGLKRIAQQRIETMKREQLARQAAAAAPPPEPVAETVAPPEAPPAPEPAPEPTPQADSPPANPENPAPDSN